MATYGVASSYTPMMELAHLMGAPLFNTNGWAQSSPYPVSPSPIDVLHFSESLILQANESFSTAYSGGRDRKVWSFDLRNTDSRALICEEKAPVLKVRYHYKLMIYIHAMVTIGKK